MYAVVYLGMKLLDPVVTLGSLFSGTAGPFLNAAAPLHIAPVPSEGSDFFTSLPALAIISLVMRVILVGVKMYLIVVLIVVSLMANAVQHASCLV